ncbi:MAG TPA: error-prone DNA polymerase, partial [Mycobacteriales bacterium]|nr:error-prone DNA polymerase [Mycobacteriales bacterium]
MGYDNPPIPWSELERRLSDRPLQPAQVPDGGDAPAWSRKRAPYVAPDLPAAAATTSYAELHCHSTFSFLDGASSPESLVEEAARLGLTALAITDHDGFYGVVRFAEAAAAVGLKTVYGAELSIGLTTPRAGVPDPEGHHLVVLARGLEGYARLSRTISKALMDGGTKGKPVYDVSALAETSGGHWLVLTGCRKGAVPQAVATGDLAAAARELADLAQAFGRGNVAVELWDHGDPADTVRNDRLATLAQHAGLPTVATNNVHYATPAQQPLAAAIAAVRARRSLDEIEGWLPVHGGAHLRSGAEMARRFARYPGAVARAAEIGAECAFDLTLVAPKLPPFPVPRWHTEMTFLREITERGAMQRYGPRHAPRVTRAYEQIDHELALIEQLGFPGYFLIVWDIVEFCRRSDILCQGRGSAANSAVCYAIGITNVDAVGYGLLFERFLSPERDGPPDIDVDIESDRREEAIQYVYARYGRNHAAQVANVITYRPRGAVRDMARALGYPAGQQDVWAKQIDAWGRTSIGSPDLDVPADVVALAEQVLTFPRHLGIHSGGMVICDRPVVDMCPVEWARMADRSVLQWDKDDCAAIGLVKFDLLGLGMLSALHYAIDLVRSHHDVEIDLATLPQEDVVYDMLCRADTIGVFQVESRAQMATLPRLKPRCFYDLVVEVALIRPGPIQGGSVHPYIRRRNGLEPVTYLHPLLERSLAKTLGVPLFQEQLMQMAIDVAGFTAGEADQLRSAMGSKRSIERMERIRGRLYEGMAERGITGEVADRIYEKLAAFASFGFPESHSVSFAYLVYASSWIKLHYPAAFCAALINAQPMGFYSPQTLVADARRHGVTVLGPDLNASAATATLEGRREAPAVRLGISSVRLIGAELAEQIAAGRPYAHMEDLASRVTLSAPQLESLATAGAFAGLGLERRAALWSAGAVAGTRPGHLAGTVTGEAAPELPAMTALDTTAADVWAIGLSPERSATEFVRAELDALGVVTAAGL